MEIVSAHKFLATLIDFIHYFSRLLFSCTILDEIISWTNVAISSCFHKSPYIEPTCDFIEAVNDNISVLEHLSQTYE